MAPHPKPATILDAPTVDLDLGIAACEWCLTWMRTNKR